MIGLLVLFVILFPAACLIPSGKTSSQELLNRDQSTFWKGAATCFVIIAHLSIMLQSVSDNKILDVTSFLGGMGVLIFFFLSGYGLYIAYFGKTDDRSYLMKRLTGVVIPYLIIKFFFILIRLIVSGISGAGELLSAFDDWFIDVILIQYVLFLISRKIAKNNKIVFILSNLFMNCVLAAVFIVMGTNPRWYNALLMFPAGIFAACVKKTIVSVFKKHMILSSLACIVLFGAFSLVFVKFKAQWYGNIAKTVSGAFLCLLIGFLSLLWEFRSPIMAYIGKNSLYFYIVHLEIKKLLERSFSIDPVTAGYIILLGTVILVPLFSVLNGKLFGKKGKAVSK